MTKHGEVEKPRKVKCKIPVRWRLMADFKLTKQKMVIFKGRNLTYSGGRDTIHQLSGSSLPLDKTWKGFQH